MVTVSRSRSCGWANLRYRPFGLALRYSLSEFRREVHPVRAITTAPGGIWPLAFSQPRNLGTGVSSVAED